MHMPGMIERNILLTITLLAVTTLVDAQVAVYGQCGGQGYTGSTVCAAGSVCTYSNPYYSQCLPSSSTSPATTTSSAPGGSTTGTVIKIGSAGQVINGIGASGAWWPLDLYKFPSSVQSQVAKLLFDSSPSSSGGAGLTSYRYNLGGGGVGVGTASRAPGTFYVSKGNYNWNADPQGVYFLKQAAAYGVPQLTLFVNSAPPAFTSNSKSCGGTINTSSISDFATYIADVISHWKSQGVTFTHISPMNEPDNSFGGSPCGQEGMIVQPSQRAQVVQAIRSALNSAGLSSVVIIADESSTASQFISEAPTWLPSAASSVGAVAHHMYGFDSDSTAAQLGTLGRSDSGKQTWFTEICCFVASSSSNINNPAAALTYGQRYDPTMVGALQLGQLIYQSFTVILDAHFDFWTALSSQLGCEPPSSSSCATTANSNGWNDGLIYYDPQYASNGNTAIYTTKRYFLFKHFARFVFMGATLYAVTGLPSGVYGLAFKAASPATTELGSAKASLILMNMGTSTQTINFASTGLGSVLGAIITNAGSDWTEQTVSSTVTLSSLTIGTVLFG